MEDTSGNGSSLVFSYLALRKAIGILGIAFPFVLSVGALLIFQTGIQGSISSYYHTGMRDVFAGTLWAIGFFLLSYKGYERADGRAGNFACICAVGVTLFPTAPDVAASSTALWIGRIHLGFAAAFFLTLSYFSLFLFTRTDPSKPPTKKKLQRNRVYKVCGYLMLICILLIAVYFRLPGAAASFLATYNPVFWLETIAVIAFGISWLTKGEAILKDQE
jgi:hypothetical protein